MKAKRKAHPYNSRQYWIIFSVLALLLLIPFRIVGYWVMTNLIYIAISVIMGIVLIRFIRQYGWKRWIIVLMMFGAILPVFQITQNHKYQDCHHLESNNLIQSVSCSYHESPCFTNFFIIGNTTYGVQKTLVPPSSCWSWYL